MVQKKVETYETFAFNKANSALAKKLIGRYPTCRQASAVIPLLDMAQRQCGGWLPQSAMRHVAEMLAMPEIRVYEVATFYSMFNLKPVGKHFIQVCTTTPCWLRGSGEIMDHCRTKLGLTKGETTHDGLFTVTEVECLGACVNAPMVQINDDYYEDLTVDTFDSIIEDLAADRPVTVGSALGRTSNPIPSAFHPSAGGDLPKGGKKK
jgi:NADH-quinone oxidoreductase E subunit